MKKLFVFMAMALVAATTFVSCSDDDDNNTPAVKVPTRAELVAGLYEGEDTMSFAMLSGVQPYTVDGIDTLNIEAINDTTVKATYKACMTHTMLGPTFRAHVAGVLSHITLKESGDSILFSNIQADGSQPDSIQAAMNQALTPATKHYAADFTGAVSKTTHEGVFHIDTKFGAMGAVHFTFTRKKFTAAVAE